ncbi:MAG: hypothetical protein J5449_04755 [Oscillospiraceae bacterium]|nr:hypothetical protein [Oscillospiraceae bacterium]
MPVLKVKNDNVGVGTGRGTGHTVTTAGTGTRADLGLAANGNIGDTSLPRQQTPGAKKQIKDPNGNDLTGTGITLRDYSTDTTDWLSLAKNAQSIEEMHQYLYNNEMQAKAQGRTVNDRDVSQATMVFYDQRPREFRAADNTVKSGYYGQDENGVWGYFKDPERTQKYDGEFDYAGKLGALKNNAAAYERAKGKIKFKTPDPTGNTVLGMMGVEGWNKTNLPKGLEEAEAMRKQMIDKIASGEYVPDGVYYGDYQDDVDRFLDERFGSGDGDGSGTGGSKGGGAGNGRTGAGGIGDTGGGTGGGAGSTGGTGGNGGGTGGGEGIGPAPGPTPGVHTVVDVTPDPGVRTQNDDLAAELKALYGENGPYAQALEAYKAAQAAAVAREINRLEGQKSSVNSSYSDLYRQAYIDSMNSQKDLDQRLAAQGINGGMAESTRLGYASAYADALRRGEQSRISEIDELDRAIANAQLSGDLSASQLVAQMTGETTDKYAAALQALINRGDMLASQDWSRRYQLSRDAVNDARYTDELDWNRRYRLNRDAVDDSRYDNEWAYRLSSDAYNRQLAAEQLAYNRQQDAYNRQLAAEQLAYSMQQDAYNRQLAAEQLAYNRQQDAYSQALRQAQLGAQLGDYSGYEALGYDISALTGSANAYIPTFTVAQLQKELEYARKNGTALSPTVLSDYEFYYGEPYGTGTVTGGAGRAAGVPQGVGYNNSGLSTEAVKNIQRAWNAAHPEQPIAVDGYWGPNSQSITKYANAAAAQAGLSLYGSSQAGSHAPDTKLPY